ncbi:hypothetical protein Tco_0189352 [Tanacetum coccineum]
MAALPRCDELRRAVNSSEWEDMFILYYRRAVSEDVRLAREINALCVGLTAVIGRKGEFLSVDGFWKRGLFVEFSFVFLASSWFFAGRAVAVWLGGGVPVFKEEDDTVCSAVGSGVPMPRLLAASSLDRHACNFSASSFHGCPVILSAAGVKKVRGAVAEFADRGCGFADEVGNLVSHPNLQLWVEVIEVFKTHVGLCVIIESSIEVVNLKKTEPEL